jgi:hypothetical protein
MIFSSPLSLSNRFGYVLLSTEKLNEKAAEKAFSKIAEQEEQQGRKYIPETYKWQRAEFDKCLGETEAGQVIMKSVSLPVGATKAKFIAVSNLSPAFWSVFSKQKETPDSEVLTAMAKVPKHQVVFVG